MKQLITLFLITASLLSFSQTSYLDCSLKKAKKKKVFYVQSTEIEEGVTETSIRFISDGKLLKTISSNDATGISTETIYWNKGGKRYINNYKNNLLEGVKTIYYWAGLIKSETNYEKGFKIGIEKVYNFDGSVMTLNTNTGIKGNRECNDYDYRDSIVTTYKEINYKKLGPVMERNFVGILLDSCYFVSGKIVGSRIGYYESGKVKYKYQYIDALKEGDQFYYLENGEIEKTEFYSKGDLVSTKVKNEVTLEKDKNYDDVFTVVEKMPEYPGGYEKMFEYLGRTIRYPGQARELGAKGKVYVQFIVEKDGSISELDVIRGIGEGCDEVALQAVENMPTWSPGEQRGTPVRVRFILPVNFTLR
jgi:TonB family protein